MPAKNKIVVLGPAYPLRGGLAAFNERMCREFIELGHEVIIYTFSLQYPSVFFPGKSQFSTEEAPTDLKIKVCINSINPLNWIKIGKQIAKENADIVIIRYWIPFMSPCLGTIARVAKQKSRSKIIGLLDNIIPHEKRFGDVQLTKYFVKPFHSFIAMSKQVKIELKQFTKAKCEIAPHPVYDQFGSKVDKITACNKLKIDDDKNYLLFFGFIRKYKGLDLLIDAFSKALKKNINLRLLIAGEFYEDEEKYLDQIKKLNIGDFVILKNDYIADSEVKYYFSAADLIVQPYRTATQSGISQIAYHFEKPMLVTKVGGLPEIVIDNFSGLIAEVNADSIAEKMMEFYDNKLESKLIEGVKQEKVKYSWNYFCEKVLSL